MRLLLFQAVVVCLAVTLTRPVFAAKDEVLSGNAGNLEATAQQKPLPDIMLKVEDKTYSLTERMAFHKVLGVSIALIKAGKVEWVQYFGDAGPHQKVDKDTLFPMGALGHPLVAAAFLRAGEQKRFDP